jgi:hypothetical protein
VESLAGVLQTAKLDEKRIVMKGQPACKAIDN